MCRTCWCRAHGEKVSHKPCNNASQVHAIRAARDQEQGTNQCLRLAVTHGRQVPDLIASDYPTVLLYSPQSGKNWPLDSQALPVGQYESCFVHWTVQIEGDGVALQIRDTRSRYALNLCVAILLIASAMRWWYI